MATFKTALRRLWPLLVAGGVAALSSGSFAHFLAAHPALAPLAVALTAVLHALDVKKGGK